VLNVRIANRLRKLLKLPHGLRFALGWHATGAFLGIVISTGIALLDPFDIGRGVGERGRDAFYEIAAFAYPEASSPKTVVVLLDDRFLLSSQRAWPVSAATHAGAIETIARYQPQAIVIDFMFLDERDDPSLEFFIETLERVVERPIRIYIAAPPRDVLGRYARPEIEDLVAREDRIEFVSVSAGRDVGAGSTYPTRSEDDALRPAAVALYEDLCNRPGGCDLSADAAEMDIWWAVPRRDRFNCGGEAQAVCDHIPAGPISRSVSVLLGMFGTLLPPSWRPLDITPIPYAPTVGLQDFVSGEHDSALQPRVSGGVVFYGSNIAFGNDYEMTPAQGLMPSVHAHAMAYDNLVALRGDYIRAQEPFGWGPKQHLFALIIVLFGLSFVARTIASFMRPQLLARPHKRERYFGAMDSLVFVVASLVIVAIEFFLGRIGPQSWAPVLAIVAAGDLLSSRRLTGAGLTWLTGRRRTACPTPAPHTPSTET
jgi:CHASE2 domain-containing sensor protein